MGQAKQRGTFEQRQQAAYERIENHIDARKKELEELTAFEQRQNDFIAQIATMTLDRIERENARNAVATALTRTDFSLVGLRSVTELTLPFKQDEV